jgi:isopenicillin N synthase-like dioxygenase
LHRRFQTALNPASSQGGCHRTGTFQYKLRATHYPSQPKALDDEFGIAPHTNTGFLTLLAPNDVPGLATIKSKPAFSRSDRDT